MKFVFRADDAGSSEGANRAILECVRAGVIRNVSVMVPGPAFDHAVPFLKELNGVDLGLHVTLNSEWDTVKWGPLTHAPSLVEPDGSFTQNPGVLQARGFSLDEAEREVRAQLAKMRDAGLKTAYLDEHMGVGWIDGLVGRLRYLCSQEGLIYNRDIPYLATVRTHNINDLLTDLSQSEEPVATVVFHPGSDNDPVLKRFIHPGLTMGQIYDERTAERRVLTDPNLKSSDFVSLTYTEAAAFLRENP